MDREYKSEWWSIKLPPDWVVEDQAECKTFFLEAGVGTLSINAARNNKRHATDDDLKDSAKEHIEAGAHLKTISCGNFVGFYFHYSVDETYCREWWLRCKNTIVLATYNCDLEDKGKEDANVDGILQTLRRE